MTGKLWSEDVLGHLVDLEGGLKTLAGSEVLKARRRRGGGSEAHSDTKGRNRPKQEGEAAPHTPAQPSRRILFETAETLEGCKWCSDKQTISKSAEEVLNQVST